MLKKLLSSAMVLACVACQAQQEMKPMAATVPMVDSVQPKAEPSHSMTMHQAIKNELQLSDAQDMRMQTAHADFQAKAAAIRTDKKLTLSQKKTALRSLEKEHEKTVSSILTPEQQVKHNAFLAKKQSIRQERAATRKQLKKELNMTAAQEKQLESIRNETHRKKQSIVSNTLLTESEKTAQLQTLAAEHQTKVRGILTKEQVAKIQAATKQAKQLQSTFE
jgi:Spy/CpxP family protein refolding chaperone